MTVNGYNAQMNIRYTEPVAFDIVRSTATLPERHKP
jgi:hypothetical protein